LSYWDLTFIVPSLKFFLISFSHHIVSSFSQIFPLFGTSQSLDVSWIRASYCGSVHHIVDPCIILWIRASYCGSVHHIVDLCVILWIRTSYCGSVHHIVDPCIILWIRASYCGSVHHSIIHKENPTRSNSVSKFYYSILRWFITAVFEV